MHKLVSDLVDEELEQVPIRLKPFIKKGGGINYGDQGWFSYEYQYKEGFEALADTALEVKPRGGYLEPVLFFLARHSIELSLKSVTFDLESWSGIEAVHDTHNLMKLWNWLQKQMLAMGFAREDYGAYCEKLVNHINEVDPTGERFRYPSNNAKQPFEQADLDLEGLIKAHWHITTYADACRQMLSASRD